MLVGPLPIRPVFTHNQFYVVASFLHNIWWLPFNFRFSFFSGFTLRSVSRDNFTFFDILERVLPSCCCFSSQNSSLTWLRLWSWLRYCDFPFSCTLSCNAIVIIIKGESYISSQVVFIRMKWDNLIAKDAVLVHLCLKRDVLEQLLRTVWHVHMVTDALSLRYS